MSGVSAALAIGGWLVRCKACLAVLGALALLTGGGLYGVTVEKARSDARIEAMKRSAQEAAERRDAEISDALEKKYNPVIEALNAQKATLQQKVKDYANKRPQKAGARKAGAKPAACKLGDAAGLLQRRQPG